MTAPIRVAGHFGEWVQGRLGSEGPVVLITMSSSAAGVSMVQRPSNAFEVTGSAGLSTENGAAFLAALGIDLPMAEIDIASDVPPGAGTGVSTASLLALASGVGAFSPDELAQACRKIEGAVDPLMLSAPDTVLWASRRAEKVRSVSPPPEVDVVGGLWGPSLPTDAVDDGFADVSDLVAAWDAATERPEATADLASEAAVRTTRLRGPMGDPTSELARELGALGWCRAHTGSARGLIFRPGQVPERAVEDMSKAGYDRCFVFRTGARP